MSSIEGGRFVRTDLWREGEWLDLWSVVHFLSGASIGLVFYFVHLGFIAPTALALVLLISYEMWEMLVKIEETPANRFMDVVVGMTGYLLVFLLLAPRLSRIEILLTFAAVLATDILMSIFGWRASQKAAALKERMLTRYAIQRARLIKQKIHLEERFRR